MKSSTILLRITAMAVVCIICFPFKNLIAQCIATTTRSATVFANDNSIGAVAFDNPSRAVSSNDSYADADAIAFLFSGTTQYLKATGFGFTIPPDAAICGVVVDIERSDGGFLSIGTGLRDHEVKLVISNAVAGNNKATGGNWGTTDTYVSYGNSSDTWGNILTPAIVNSGNFGVAIAAKFNGLASLIPSADIDHIRMTIYYNPLLPTHILSFTSAQRNDKVTLQWKTADEEDGETITLQRSSNIQSQWTDLTKFEMHTGNTIKSYAYTDLLSSKGKYLYRLQIKNVYGELTYSETKSIQYNGKQEFNVFPNPATSTITIEGITDPQKIIISNYSMSMLKVPVQRKDNNSITIDISQLPPGVYFARSDVGYVKFLKR